MQFPVRMFYPYHRCGNFNSIISCLIMVTVSFSIKWIFFPTPPPFMFVVITVLVALFAIVWFNWISADLTMNSISKEFTHRQFETWWSKNGETLNQQNFVVAVCCSVWFYFRFCEMKLVLNAYAVLWCMTVCGKHKRLTKSTRQNTRIYNTRMAMKT